MREFEKELLNTPLVSVMRDNNLFIEDVPFDEYHLVMAQTDILEGIAEERAVKTYFYRIPPFSGSYVLYAGLAAFLNKLNSFSYRQIVPYLKRKGYSEEFIRYAEKRDKITADIYSVPENSVIFPDEPAMILETSLIDARILEGIVLSELNFGSLSATKWHRIRSAAMDCSVSEFGRRRAQNSLKASLYSYMAGIEGTSNCEANNIFGIPSSGTMGHEYVQSFADEFTAFDRWLEHNPLKPCLLIDTVNTLQSGIYNAEKAFLKHKQRLIDAGSWGKIGFRIDSGDLAYLASYCYKMLAKKLGTADISVVLSNDLDEGSVESIITQLTLARQIDVIKHISFGLGTRGVTAWGEPALGGVCKISEIGNNYILKISNNSAKITIPGNLRSASVSDKNGEYVTTLIYFKDEDISKINKCYHPNDDSKSMPLTDEYTISPKHSLVYSAGVLRGEYSNQTLSEIKRNSKSGLDMLDWSYKRIANPHQAKVSLSPKVFDTRWKMIRNSLISMPKNS